MNWAKLSTVLMMVGICTCRAYAGDGVPITSIQTQRSAATASGPYSIGGNTITYGVGDNVRITGANVGALNLQRSSISKPGITINRINNLNVSGDRLTMFYPGQVSGSTVNIEGDEATSMEQAMNDDYLTSGGLDVFLNQDTGVEKANNIERIDFVVPEGIQLPTALALLNEVGTIANEKHGNNTYKIAMITGIDGFGAPTSFGNLKTIQGNVDYGNVGRPQNASGTALRNLYLRNGSAPVSGGGNGPVGYVRSDTNFIGLSFISFGALGATPGQIVYGYSLFPNDMFDSNDLVGLTDAPLNTNGSVNGGDIYGGTFAIFSTPAAEAETSEGAPDLLGIKNVEVYDPLAAGLHAIPGNDMIYTISVQNEGTASPDPNTVFLVDTLPEDVEFYNGDIDDSGPQSDPVTFIDSGSGMTFTYAASVGFSTLTTRPTDMTGCNATPAAGYDPAIRHICFQPSGTLASGNSSPGFEVQFRARIR